MQLLYALLFDHRKARRRGSASHRLWRPSLALLRRYQDRP